MTLRTQVEHSTARSRTDTAHIVYADSASALSTFAATAALLAAVVAVSAPIVAAALGLVVGVAVGRRSAKR